MSKGKNSKEPQKSEGDVVYEPNSELSSDISVSDGDSAEAKIKKIKGELVKCQKERQEYLDGWQRARAEFINLKKRADDDKKEFAKYATEEFIIELLPALDSFEQAFKNKKSWEKASLDWRMGIEFIYSQLRGVLTARGVTEINPAGEMFDPALHHSIDTVVVDDGADEGKIIEVVQKGYRLGDKIIRHPNVKVGKIE